MCANYIPVTRGDLLLAHFGVQRDVKQELPPELYPTDLGPFVRLVNGHRQCEAGLFGLLPPWRREVAFGRNTYNSRSETVDTKASFKESWQRGLRCVIPAEAVFEPRYNDDHTSERWRIENDDGTPMGIAGVYSQWVDGGVEKFSYSMLTVNCDRHPFYSQFHEPGKEKRMPIFLAPEEYDGWMSCALAQAPRFFRMWTGPLKGGPAARPKQPLRMNKVNDEVEPERTKALKRPRPEPPQQASLF
ncbi:MAG: SOS response-associated peptidase [Alcaligenaceae bacterium]|nr:MAG: SOS response-associated peptidase [Alcaligenaceae bacterium]